MVNTSRVETAWLHYPGITKGESEMWTVPSVSEGWEGKVNQNEKDLNIMVHLRNWTIVEQRRREKRWAKGWEEQLRKEAQVRESF